MFSDSVAHTNHRDESQINLKVVRPPILDNTLHRLRNLWLSALESSISQDAT